MLAASDVFGWALFVGSWALALTLAGVGFLGARVNPRGYFVGAITGSLLCFLGWSLVGTSTAMLVESARPAQVKYKHDIITVESSSRTVAQNIEDAWPVFWMYGTFLVILGWLVGGLGGALFLKLGPRVFLQVDDEPESRPADETPAVEVPRADDGAPADSPSSATTASPPQS